MKKIFSLFAISLLFGLTGFQCSKVDCCLPPPCSEKQTLTGSWKLDYFQNVTTDETDVDPQLEGKGVVLTFSDDEKEGAIEGHTFVNEISGAYTLGAGCTLNITNFGGTKVGEPAWSNKAWLVAGKSGSYQIIGDGLIIGFSNSPERMIFRKI